jgi:hypothetical protein
MHKRGGSADKRNRETGDDNIEDTVVSVEDEAGDELEEEAEADSETGGEGETGCDGGDGVACTISL